MLGTFMLTIVFVSANNFDLAIMLWILAIFSAKINGGQYNPAITIMLMFKRSKKRILFGKGLCLIISQLFGALMGAFLMVFLSQNSLAPMQPSSGSLVLAACL